MCSEMYKEEKGTNKYKQIQYKQKVRINMAVPCVKNLKARMVWYGVTGVSHGGALCKKS